MAAGGPAGGSGGRLMGRGKRTVPAVEVQVAAGRGGLRDLRRRIAAGVVAAPVVVVRRGAEAQVATLEVYGATAGDYVALHDRDYQLLARVWDAHRERRGGAAAARAALQNDHVCFEWPGLAPNDGKFCARRCLARTARSGCSARARSTDGRSGASARPAGATRPASAPASCSPAVRRWTSRAPSSPRGQARCGSTISRKTGTSVSTGLGTPDRRPGGRSDATTVVVPGYPRPPRRRAPNAATAASNPSSFAGAIVASQPPAAPATIALARIVRRSSGIVVPSGRRITRARSVMCSMPPMSYRLAA